METDAERRNRRALRSGEWACTETRCGAINDEYKKKCNECGAARSQKNRTGKQEIGKDGADKSKGLFHPDDWVCTKCGNVNWARRNTCNLCNASKFADNEQRTGYGGGFMDRQDVEYKPKVDEGDEEFDEFGRRKRRKFHSSDSSVQKKKTKTEEEPSRPAKNDDDEEDDDDDDDDGDLDKYKLFSDEEESDKLDDGSEHKTDGEKNSKDIDADSSFHRSGSVATSDCSCSCSGGECTCSEDEEVVSHSNSASRRSSRHDRDRKDRDRKREYERDRKDRHRERDHRRNDHR